MYNKDIKQVLEEQNTSLNGLTEEEANKRLILYGKNIIKESKRKSKFKIFLSQFNDTMIIILIIVAILMFIYGYFYSNEYTDTIVIAVVVIINAIMGFAQESKAEVTLEGLKKYTKTNCMVKRNNNVMVIDSENIVPGDIILLEAGDMVPIDGRIIESSNLVIDESPLTGESIPISKDNKTLTGILPIQEQANMVFSGCNILNGTACVVVVNTGIYSEIGKIATKLNTPYEVKTPLEIKISEISKKITILVFIIIVLMFIYGIFNNYKIMEIIMLCTSLAVAVIPEGLPTVITIALSGGASSLAKKKTIVRQMSSVETLGSTDIICSDKTGTITQNKMQVIKTVIYDDKMFKYIALLANDSKIDKDKIIGDPTETCLIDFFKKDEDINKFRESNKRIMSYPFDSNRKMMSTLNNINGNNYLLVKGSVEHLLLKCKYFNDEILSKDKIDEIKEKELNMSKEALRVIGFAYKKVNQIPNDLIHQENDLVFVGMVGIIDPPRKNVKDSVLKCKKAGIRTVMITGDSLVTACAIAKNIGIIEQDSEGILGSNLDKYTDEELKEIVKKYNVYARVNSTHKTRIVNAWQANNKVVAMTGDGVNDAPAIKDAHVGIGMGISGTEVTKSVADIILLDDSFDTIVVAIEEGRRIFTNIQNNVVYSLSSNFAELFIVLIGMFMGYTILLPIHILFIDLITDTIPSICLSFEKSEKNIMNKTPRGINKTIFTPFIKACIAYSSIVETIIVICVYFISLYIDDINFAITTTLFSIVVQEILYAVSCRNLKEYIYKQGIFSNKIMNIGLIIVVIIELIFFLTPVGRIINIKQINIFTLLIILIFNMIGLLLYEIGKPILKKLFKD